MSTRDLPDWRAGALCAQIGGDMFFPPKGGSDRSAKIICAMCDVRIQCLKWALDNHEIYEGIYGGLNPGQRRKMMRERLRRAA